MTIRVALNHRTTYRYDRSVTLSPHVVRLRPAPHCRTPVSGYSLKVRPENHFENWQQDPQGNLLLRCVFPDPVATFEVEVDLIAEMTVINPFDFFVEAYADEFPFSYEPAQQRELYSFLQVESPGPELAAYLEGIDRRPRNTVDFLVELNSRLAQEVSYLIRMEPGVQTPGQTLAKKSGSCRDSAWLLVHILRNLGIAARFVSGYLIQLVPDVKPLDGPAGATEDFTDLHAWAEAFVPGAGWVGMDPTSGLLAGEGHLPLASTPEPASAAPISGAVGNCETEFDFAMSVQRIHEDPRVTKPYTQEQWTAILAVGDQVDERLTSQDVRLTMGGEPTFVSVDEMESPEWNTAAVGPTKRDMGMKLLRRLATRFAPDGFQHYGQGKWYPGEPLPRWGLSVFWRTDGEPLWTHPSLFAHTSTSPDKTSHNTPDNTEEPPESPPATVEQAGQFMKAICDELEVDKQWVREAYEDVWHHIAQERKLPVNVDLADSKLDDAEERARLAALVERGLDRVAGYVLPLTRSWWQAKPQWQSGPWPFRSERLCLLPGDSPMGLRLPIESLPWVPANRRPWMEPVDPFAPRGALPPHPGARPQREVPTADDAYDSEDSPQPIQEQELADNEAQKKAGGGEETEGFVRTALCVQPREGALHVFMPPVQRADDYVELLGAIERSAVKCEQPVVIEGYVPPTDPRLQHIKVTPDPGVIEVNVHPAASWRELVETTEILYEEAHQSRLGTDKFDLDGRHTGTGGGNHVVLGGPTPADSPFLRRPDLLSSLVAFWNNHPSLSYLFSGTFIGPTSQAPRVDEGRRDAIYELELACRQVPLPSEDSSSCPPWLVDRIFRNLLVDLTGNTHRAEFCIDKLFSPDSATGRLGLVEFRAFEMPPHYRMSLTQQLLLRSLVACFWEQPYRESLVRWGTNLHDRFLLPDFVRRDFAEVVDYVGHAGIPIQREWFDPHFEFRFPNIGSICHQGVQLELRQAIEPWYVLGEEPAGGATTRFVDSSVERLEVKVTGMTDDRHGIMVNGVLLPLHATGVAGEFVAGVRYRAWQPPNCLHPTIPVDTPLVFDIWDHWNGRSIGGCTYHVAHPAGRNYETFPVNAYEAEARRAARFFQHGHTPGTGRTPQSLSTTGEYPLTLDLRRTHCTP